jgi:hypothetical protein
MKDKGLFRVKIEYEEIPIADSKVDIVGFDKLYKQVKKKFM